MRCNVVKYLLLIMIFGIVNLNAQNMDRNSEKELRIEQQLDSLDHSMVTVFQEATAVMDKDNYSLADSLFSKVIAAAPKFDPAIRRLGIVRMRSNRTAEGMALIEKAISINRSADNLFVLAEYLAFPDLHKLGPKSDVLRAYDLLKEAQSKESNPDASYPILLAQIALRDQEVNIFRDAVSTLENKYPGLMVTHYFRAILATIDEDWTKANDEIHKAEKLGLSQEEVQTFLDSGVERNLMIRHSVIILLLIIAAWGLGLGMLYLIGKLLSAFTLKSITKADPNIPINTSEHLLRKIYRMIINSAGVYYYISLPVVIILVIAFAAAVIYFFMMIGRIPINIVMIVGVGAIVTIFKMIQSLFIKVKPEDPGRQLIYEEAPGLWDLTKKVADDLNTRPIDEIRVTTGADMAVYERGTWQDKVKDRAHRILILGVATLNDFKQSDFCAVLAHEYGHFSHRDTAGGDIAFRVVGDMNRFFMALYYARQATKINIAVHFLRLYSFIFRRISHGATRLQEVLADRVAAQTYGKKAFQNGLIHVIRREIEFNLWANQEIEQAIKAQQELRNLYELKGTADTNIETEMEKALNRNTTEDDTHPSPLERFRLISDLKDTDVPENQTPVWNLFKDRAALTIEMTLLIEDRLKKAGKIPEAPANK